MSDQIRGRDAEEGARVALALSPIDAIGACSHPRTLCGSLKAVAVAME